MMRKPKIVFEPEFRESGTQSSTRRNGTGFTNSKTLFSRSFNKVKPKPVSKKGMRKVYSSDTLVIRQRRGKHGGWMYVDYKDVTSGRWIRDVRIRTGDYRRLMEYMDTHPVPKGLADSSGANFRTVMLESGNPTVTAVSDINKAIGLLKTYRANGGYGGQMDHAWWIELQEYVEQGNVSRIREMVAAWFLTNSDEEIEDFFDYEDEELEIFEGYL